MDKMSKTFRGSVTFSEADMMYYEDFEEML